MITSNLGDLSSFEPEAILKNLPGEHPRLESAVGLGRNASETGDLDVAALSQLANEIFTEKFPGASTYKANESSIPSTSSLSHAVIDAEVPKNVAPEGTPPSKASGEEVSKIFSHQKIESHDVSLHNLLGDINVPYENEVKALFNFEQLSKDYLNQLGTNDFYFLNRVSPPSSGSLTNLPFETKPAFDVNLIRKDFPVLREIVNGRSLVWFDNAATTQKPQSVIDRISYFYQHENSNIHRAAHELAARATDAYEGAREKVRGFLNAKSVNEIVFTRGTTEAINLVAQSWGRQNLKEGDEIVLSQLEHHANIVPWQLLAKETGVKIRVIPVNDDGELLIDEYQNLLSNKTKLVSFTQVSNALGTVTPAKQIIDLAHTVGAKVLLDGAQSVSHLKVDLQDLNPDWFVFSGHKVFGPTGIGALFGKEDLLNQTQPWQGGGNMIKDVTFEHTEFHDAPGRFEAGTGNIADAVGLGAAIDYVNSIGIDVINQYEHELLIYATSHLKNIEGLRLVGTAKDKASVLSFVIPGIQTEDIGAALNKEGIAVRSGHHCAQPILRRMGLETTVRPSLAFYNTHQEIDRLVEAIYRIKSFKH
ncbi:MAG: family 2A encapsulin nanocompartment cargo protein cysteine desulfurase [Candidatus Methylopumilus universalis]